MLKLLNKVKTEPILLGLCGSVGALFAVCADIFQKGKAGAIFTTAENAGAALGQVSLGLAYIAGIVVILAFLGTMVFGAESRKAAFYFGVGVFSFLMTAAPNQHEELPDLDGYAEEAVEELGVNAAPGLLPAMDIPIVYAAEVSQGLTNEMELRVSAYGDPDRLEYTVLLRDGKSLRKLARTRTIRKTLRFRVKPGRYIIEVEADGYELWKGSVEVEQIALTRMNVVLEPSGVPMALQRVFGSEVRSVPNETAKMCDLIEPFILEEGHTKVLKSDEFGGRLYASVGSITEPDETHYDVQLLWLSGDASVPGDTLTTEEFEKIGGTMVEVDWTLNVQGNPSQPLEFEIGDKGYELTVTSTRTYFFGSGRLTAEICSSN